MSTEADPIEEELVAATDPLIGTTLAERYLILEPLGAGGMSSVYKAEQLAMKRLVAVKIMHRHLQTDPNAIKRFQQESTAAGTFSHPNVVTVHDCGKTSDGSFFLVMDYIEGKSLAEELKLLGRLSYTRATSIFLQVIEGLLAVHQHGIIHRDIKPSNIMLSETSSGTELVRIVDFGIAKFIDNDNMQKLTQTGEVYGSPLYMSPEQCQGQAVDKRSDIYSLGCVFYEALCGDPPHLGASSIETMRKHVFEIARPFKQVAPGLEIPQSLEEIVFRMIEAIPSKRYADLLEVKNDLLEIAENSFSRSIGIQTKVGRLNRELKRKFKLSKTSLAYFMVIVLTAVLAWALILPWCMSEVYEHFYVQAAAQLQEGKYADAEESILKAQFWAGFIYDNGAAMSRSLEILATIYKKTGRYVAMEETRAKQQAIVQNQLEKKFGIASEDLNEMSNSALSEVSKPAIASEAQEGAIYRLSALAGVCTQHNQLDLAEKLMRRAVQICEQNSGKSAPGRSSLYGSLALICARKQNFDDAEQFFQRQLESARQDPGPRKAALIAAEINMVKVCTEKKDFDTGEKFARSALKSAQQETGNSSLLVKSCLETYAALMRTKGDDVKAGELEIRAGRIKGELR